MPNQPNQETPGQSFVDVTINGRQVSIHRGSHTVSDLKTLLDVDASYALDMDVDGTLTPLADTGRVTIKGGEVFFSHPRTGASAR